LCFLIPAAFALLGSLGIITLIKNSPSEVGLPEVVEKKTQSVQTDAEKAEYNAFVRRKVFGNRLIWTLALTNFFVYVVRFAALDWGPTMLTESKGLTLAMATTLCIVFEFIGGNIGMVFWGWLTDKFFKSKAHQTCVLCMAGAAASVAVFWAIPEGTAWWIQILPFTFIGFFVYGPQALLGISAANQATNRAAATANGILGIFGYASTLISGVGFGYVAQHYGWNGAYLTILIMSLLGVVTLLTMWNAPANGYED
jgi:OPA family glycerol-3-phosphate transporter-like MFS transporter/OPA family sugar phosphate sensor protein UhpC-like MFS transporter